jgi:hypothetical protein
MIMFGSFVSAVFLALFEAARCLLHKFKLPKAARRPVHLILVQDDGERTHSHESEDPSALAGILEFAGEDGLLDYLWAIMESQILGLFLG